MVKVEHSSLGHSNIHQIRGPSSLYQLAGTFLVDSLLSSLFTWHSLVSALPLAPCLTSSGLAIIFPLLQSWGKHIQWKIIKNMNLRGGDTVGRSVPAPCQDVTVAALFVIDLWKQRWFSPPFYSSGMECWMVAWRYRLYTLHIAMHWFMFSFRWAGS